MKLFISPHNDDETLFGAFTICKYRPAVAIVFDSFIQVDRGHWQATAAARRQESLEALAIMGILPGPRTIHFCGISDILPKMATVRAALVELRDKFNPSEVWAPAVEKEGHAQHNMVATAAHEIFQPILTPYLTYTTSGKSRSGHEVASSGDMVARKLRALACYTTQLDIHNCRPHFLRDLAEYQLVNDTEPLL